MPSPHISQALAVYTKGTKAWFPDEQEGWVSATLQTSDVNDTSVKLVFVNDDDGNREHVFQSSVADLEKDKGASLPPLRNPPKMECAEDLTNLSHLNEPSVLHTIRARYMQRLIYTYSGIVLIATNPFDRVSLYDPEIIQKYSGRRRGELEPHLFAIAEDAYRCMIREKSNQTIIVSGESGAGKTVSAKYIMRYFATADDKETVGKAKHSDGAMTEVEEQILATNPIMEAFGNAKTTRNDNSSRFGKYIEIQFDSRCNIVGAKIRTYLLERSRLIFQPPTERNYHIFYQLCKGASAEEREKFGLREWSEFHYLNQGGTGEINGVDDVAELAITKTSLSKVGISEDTQQQIFRLLAALLHLGNIEIGGRTDAMLAEDDPSLQLATKLLGINSNEFKKWIVRKQIITRSEKIMTNLSPTQAQVVKDSMAKFIYANLFDWLVGVVNNSLSCSDERGGVATFIGVLDIYGFEHFKKNSFEQFCINYANEKLQQQFNQHVFKLEQEEYVRENIDWTFIEFSDNQKCIEMIEAKIGILSLLDEESRLPSGSDQGFCNKLYSNFGSSDYQDYFKKPRFSNAAFTVVHYAHDVQYEAEGFLEKNKDSVPDEHLTLLQNSEFSFLADMIQRSETIGSTPSPANGGNDSHRKNNLAMAKKPTLGSMFKLSLINLMDTIAKTNVHYIRCIKPNEAKVAWGFEPNMVLAQLRACGVLETIRISCSGYPSRWTFDEFADRYYALVDAKYWYPKKDQDVRKLCIAIVDKHIKDTDKYQFGLTKIFFRAGQLAYLEKLRTDRWTEIAIVLQKNARRYLARQKYLKMIQFVTRLQQVARQKVAKERLEDLRREKAALIIQKYWRRCLIRRWYLNQLRVITQIQAASRALIARKRFSMIREHNAATQIQRIVRGWAARKRYRAQLNHIVRLQTCIRGRNARKQLVVMRAEARSVSHFKEVSYKLENRVVELAQTLTQQKEEKARLKDKAADLEAQVRSWIAKYDQLDEKAKSLEDLVGKRSDQTSFQRKRDDLRSDYMQSFNKIKLQDKEIARLTDELSRQKQELSMIRQNSSEIADKPLEEMDMAELKSQIAALKSQLSQTLSKTRRSAKDTTNNKNNTNRHHLRRGSSNNRRHSSSHQGDATKPAIQSDHPLYEFLQDNKLLHEDVLNGLILSQTPTEPSSGSSSTQKPRKDIVYPAHLIGLCVIQLVKKGCLAEAQRWLFASTETMEKHCLSFKGQDASVPSAHWLVNAHELLSILSTSEISLEKELESSDDWHAISGFLAEAKHEILTTEENIYGHWMTETKRQLQRLIVPAIIENQSLPGFIANGSNSSSSSSSNNNNNNSSSGQAPKSVVDELLGVLSETADLVQTYMMDNFVLEQVVNELLKFIGAVAFNELIMRRNFNSWKRGMQIQCNITRLEDWCKERGMSDATIQLEHLVQATKLLQLKKSTAEDIKIIADVCWTLTPAQIHKLLQSYSPAEYEEPLSHEVLRTVASRIGTKKDVLITPSSVDEPVFFDIPVPQTSSVVDTYIPASVHVERLERFIKALC